MGAAIKNRAPGDASSFSILDQRTTNRLGLILASGSRDGSVFVWLLEQNGDGNPLGGGFTGERINSLSWQPDDTAVAAINANGGVAVWPFKIRG